MCAENHTTSNGIDFQQSHLVLSLTQHLISAIWPEMAKVGEKYTTPDEQRGSEFIVLASDNHTISIKTSGESVISIRRDSFISTLSFLLKGGHVSQERACVIGANIGEPGSLDQSTRVYSGGTMVISYIVPILEKTGVVASNGKRPNKAWINP
jgi:hypothetical protein